LALIINQDEAYSLPSEEEVLDYKEETPLERRLIISEKAS